MKKCCLLMAVILAIVIMLTGCKSKSEQLKDLNKECDKLVDQYNASQDKVNKFDSDLNELSSVCLGNFYAKTYNNFNTLQQYALQGSNFSEEKFNNFFKENIRYQTDNFKPETKEGEDIKGELVKYEDKYQKWIVTQIKKGEITRDKIQYDAPTVDDDFFEDLSDALKDSKEESEKIQSEIDDINIKIAKLELN